MSVHDELTSVQRCLDDLMRSVGRLEKQLGSGGLEMRRVRTDTDHLRESVALLRETAAGPAGAPPRPATSPRCRATPPTRASAPAAAAAPGPGTARPRGPPAPRPRPDHRDHRSPVPRPPRLVDPYRSGHVATGTEPPATEPHPRRGGVRTGTRAAIAAPHLRTDRWWLAPAATAAGLLA